MIEETISTDAARRFYDRLGAGHDWAEQYESRAKARGLELLELAPGQHVLNVGVGTGQEHRRIQDALTPGGVACGLDISPAMLRLSQARTGAPFCEAEARRLPFESVSFDRLFSSYLLDLLPASDLPPLLVEFRRVLKPGGRLILVSLTEGTGWLSKTVVGLWKAIYTINPVVCGGCRPLQLAGLVQEAGFYQVRRELVIQLGVPSEIIAAIRDHQSDRL